MSEKQAQTVYTNSNVNKNITSIKGLFHFNFQVDVMGVIKAHTHTHSSSNRYCLLVVLHTCTQSTSTQPLREQTMRNTYFQVVKLIKATKTISYPEKIILIVVQNGKDTKLNF